MIHCFPLFTNFMKSRSQKKETRIYVRQNSGRKIILLKKPINIGTVAHIS